MDAAGSTGRRRNGSQASCERCRKLKVKCDHQRPFCSACQHRGLAAQCYYHPAPMSKKRGVPSRSGSESAPSVRRLRPQANRNGNYKAASVPSQPAQEGRPRFYRPYLSQLDSIDRHVPTVQAILHRLKHLDEIHDVLSKYFTPDRLAHVPKAFLFALLDSLRYGANAHRYEDEDYARQVLEASASPINVKPDLDMEQFCALVTGTNLRIEVVGYIFSNTATAILYGSRRDELENSEILKDMIIYSKMSLQLARTLSKETTDTMLWLAYMNWQLMSLVEGEESLDAWRRMGDLSTDLFSLQVHRQDTDSPQQLPLFLSETRKRIFATSFYLDKILSFLTNRPPRIPQMFCDNILPLDVSDEALFSPEVFAEELSRLTHDGWSQEVAFRVTSGARTRCLLARFVEEMMTMQLCPAASIDEAVLRDISARAKSLWESIPAYLRYSQDSWNLGFSPHGALLLAKLYLTYRWIDYQTFSLLSRSSDLIPTELLQAAWDMIEVLVQISKARFTSKFSGNDLPVAFLHYGMPSAKILLRAMEELQQGRRVELLPTLSKAKLVRELSFLSVQLEINEHTTEAVYSACLQAAKDLTSKLDSILERPSVAAPPTSASVGSDHLPHGFHSVALPTMGDVAPHEAINWGQWTDWNMLEGWK